MPIDAEMLSELPDTKGQILCDSTYMRCPELAKSQIERRTEAIRDWGEGRMEKGK